ncbi:MAG TPA: winged helix-turn-helix domain-containing protein [Acidobacteriaceae bacterium]|nr:winged helix-turn-helix domain-containing protein [Acidobacteriaceae bacterium]
MQAPPSTKTLTRVTFGLFEADLRSGELRKAGYRIKLQALPFKVLTVLLEHAGEVVTREELQLRVWGPDVIVDFEHSLSNAIKKLREALGDSAENPRFIETLSRRGFRFIAPVGVGEMPTSTTAATPVDIRTDVRVAEDLSSRSGTDATPENSSPTRDRNIYIVTALAFVLGGLLAAGAYQYWNATKAPVPLPRISQITQDGTIFAPEDNLLGWLSAFVTDGVHLFTPTSESGNVVLSQISVATGVSQTVPLLSEIGSPEVNDISPDGTRLLLRSNLGFSVQQPLWIVSVDGASAFRVSNVLAQDAIWMPDGKRVLYTSGNQINIVSLQDGKQTLLATVTGRAFWPRWSPDGKTLRFTIIDVVNHTSSLWELSEGQTTARPILKGWSDSVHECCGVWTADGKYFVFEATKSGYTDLWKADASLDSAPVRITNGPLNYNAPAPGREGEQIFFIGQDLHSILERYDPDRKEYVAQQGFLAGSTIVRYSRDGRWVAWVDPTHRLWRALADGTDRVLLTPDSMRVSLVSWSPDDTRLAFMARDPRQPWQIYSVSVDGGTPERLTQENRNLGDPSFSADGKYLVFGTVAELMGDKKPRSIEIMDLNTHRITELPHSQGLFSPAWSPDGRYIAAITLDQLHTMLYDTTTMTWKSLASTSTSYPVWSQDSKAIYTYAYRAEKRPVLRINVPDGQITAIANIGNFHGYIAHADFVGIMLGTNAPLMRAEISSGNLYTMDLAQRHTEPASVLR